MRHKNPPFIQLFSAFILFFCLLLSAPADAVMFGAGVRPNQGYIFKLYPFFFTSDTRTDKNGDPAVTGLGSTSYGSMVVNSYQLGDLQVNAYLPVLKRETRKLHSEDWGIGDIQLRAGWILPVDWLTIQPTAYLKVPSGSYNKDSKVNVGDGQTDLGLELNINKSSGPYSLDLFFKYNVRFRNPDTDVTPGNEFSAEAQAAYMILPKVWLGPSVNFLVGEDNKKAGKTLGDSGLMRLSAGGEIAYVGFQHIKLALAVYQDLISRNFAEGTMVLGRIAFPF